MAVIERLWDDAEFEAKHRRWLAEARRWDGERLAEQFQQFFSSLCSRHRHSQSPVCRCGRRRNNRLHPCGGGAAEGGGGGSVQAADQPKNRGGSSVPRSMLIPTAAGGPEAG